MMKSREYEAIASAFRTGLSGGEKVRMFTLLAPVFKDLNPRFKPEQFGEEMGLDSHTIPFLLNIIENVEAHKKEVAQNGCS